MRSTVKTPEDKKVKDEDYIEESDIIEEDSDGAPDDKVITRKKLITRGIQIGSIILVGSLLVYKMFLSDSFDMSNSGQKGIVEKDKIANQPINLQNAPRGSIVSRSDLDKVLKGSVEKQRVAPQLELPELPKLPDLKIDYTPPPPPPSKVIVQNTHKDQKSLDHSDREQNPQSFNPMQATQNGIPIVNSADLTQDQRRQLNMFVIQGGGPQQESNRSGNKKNISDFMIMDGSSLAIKKVAQNVSTTRLANLDTMLVQGKMVNIILETAIDSQLPGTVRGIVSDDVYGEGGDRVLLPRGSRVFGSYSADVTRGQSRLTISMNRILRPDGVIVSISGQASDQFGRSGIEGDVDQRFGDIMANSLLVTFATLGASIALQKISGGTGVNQTVNPTNGTFTTTNVQPVNVAAQNAIQTASTTVNNMLAGATNLAPIVKLPQGTKIKVMVSQDISIPPFRRVG